MTTSLPRRLKGANHNGSTELYYSFGNKGAYEVVNDSSVGQYKSKRIRGHESNQEQLSWCRNAENLIAEHLNESVHVLKSYVRNLPKLISPVIDVAYNMQKEYGDINLKATKGINNGIWMATIALNAQTSQFHSENDCTYTLVTVPRQCVRMNKGNNFERVFLIKLNEDNIFGIPLTHSLSTVFSGNFITHRQHIDSRCYNDGSLFYNIVSYGNQRLYNHIRKSLSRINK